MKKWCALSTLALAVLTLGACKDDVFEPEPYIAGVDPDYVVRGRTQEITVSGVVTEWSTESTPFSPAITTDNVSFGEGITVESVTVINHGTVVASVTAAQDTNLGARDVQVGNETFPGVFRVVPPFEVLETSAIAPARFFQALIKGYDTLWIKDLTTVDLGEGIVHFGPEEAGGPGPLYGIFDNAGVIGAQVLDTEHMLLTGWVDAFAVPGETLDLTITGYDGVAETMTGFADVIDPGILTNTGGPQWIEEPFQNVIVDPTVPAGRSMKLRGSTSGVGFLLIFDPAVSGLTPVNPGPFYGDEGGYGDIGQLTFGYDTGGKRYVYMDLFYSLGPLYDALPSYLQLVDPATYPPSGLTHAIDLIPSPLSDGSAINGETLQFKTFDPLLDPNWYDLSLTAPAILDVNVTPTGASPTLDATVQFVGASQQLPYSRNTTGVGAVETGSHVAGPYTLIGVGDVASATGEGTEYSVSYTATPVPGTYFGSGAVVQPFGSMGNTQSDVTVNTGGATIGELHVFVNIGHAWQGDVQLVLTAPTGQSMTLCSYSCRAGVSASADGVLELYGDTTSTFATHSVTNLSGTFGGLPADGTWRLSANDTYPYLDDGVLINWGLVIN